MINRQAFSRGNQLPHPFAPLGARLRLLGLEYSIRRQELLRNILIIRRLKCFCTTNHFPIAPEVANAATLHPKRHEFRRSERICRRNLRSERSERPPRRRAPRSARPRKCPAPAVRSHGSLFVIFVTALPVTPWTTPNGSSGFTIPAGPPRFCVPEVRSRAGGSFF